MDALYLIAVIAGQRVALPASAIESVIELDAVSPVPRAAAHVLGLAALRSRVLTVIDGRAALACAPAPRSGGVLPAVVATVDGHLYALVVDAVEDVTTFATAPQPVAAVLAPAWQRVVTGDLELNGSLLVVDIAALICGPQSAAA